MFAFLFWLFLLSGIFVAMMGHSGFYHFVTGRDGQYLNEYYVYVKFG